MNRAHAVLAYKGGALGVDPSLPVLLERASGPICLGILRAAKCSILSSAMVR